MLQRARERQRKLLELDACGSTVPMDVRFKESDKITATPQSPTKKAERVPKMTRDVNSTEEGAIYSMPARELTSPSGAAPVRNVITKANTFCPSPHKDDQQEGRVPQNSHKFTKVSSDMPGSSPSQLKTLNIQDNDINMEIKFVAAENVRVEVEIRKEDSDRESDDGNSGDNHNAPLNNGVESGLREQAKYRLKKLGKLYAGSFTLEC